MFIFILTLRSIILTNHDFVNGTVSWLRSNLFLGDEWFGYLLELVWLFFFFFLWDKDWDFEQYVFLYSFKSFVDAQRNSWYGVAFDEIEDTYAECSADVLKHHDIVRRTLLHVFILFIECWFFIGDVDFWFYLFSFRIQLRKQMIYTFSTGIIALKRIAIWQLTRRLHDAHSPRAFSAETIFLIFHFHQFVWETALLEIEV